MNARIEFAKLASNLNAHFMGMVLALCKLSDEDEAAFMDKLTERLKAIRGNRPLTQVPSDGDMKLLARATIDLCLECLEKNP